MILNARSEEAREEISLPDGLPDGGAVYDAAFARGIRPEKHLSLSDWADEYRHVSAQSGSSHPGKWSTDLVPYLREVMDCLDLDHPARTVTLKKSHQSAGTEAGLNLVGKCMSTSPAPMLYLLPTDKVLPEFNRLKLGPMISETPLLRSKVREQKSRSSDGSTSLIKVFPGGFLRMTGANTSSGLKIFSARVLIADEVTEYPADVDKMGDPLKLAEDRLTVWGDMAKIFYVSTPGIEGSCRISEFYERSDQRRYFLRCPECGTCHVLKWENFRFSRSKPYRAHFLCPSGNGCVIEHHEKEALLSGGLWLKCYPGDDCPPESFPEEDLDRYRHRGSDHRDPGFHIWEAYSPFTSWDRLAEKWQDAEGKQEAEKVFTNQALGEEWKDKGDAPPAEQLYEKRESYPKARIPAGALFLTGFCDVQGNRLEWGVWAWNARMTDGWLIDSGVIEGDPQGLKVWAALAKVTARQYEDSRGRRWPIDAFGVDSGFQSNAVYRFCKGKHDQRPAVFATDGRDGRLAPALGSPSKRSITWNGRPEGSVMLWPIGTWPMKLEHYGALRVLLAAPGEEADGCRIHLPDWIDLDYCKQLTNEALVAKKGQTGTTARREWKKLGPNEALDIAVGSRALAHHLSDDLTPEQWQDLAAERAETIAADQMDLAALWSGLAGPSAPDDEAEETPVEDGQEPVPAEPPQTWLGERSSNWFRR